MQRLKRGLASMLAAVMLVTALPITALAAEASDLPEEPEVQTVTTVTPNEEGTAETAEQPEEADPADLPENPDENQSDNGMQDAADETPEPADTWDGLTGEEVIFNTGSMAVTVGSGPASPDRMYYDSFDRNGGYTIEVNEPSPFFPYEVQFTYGGRTRSEWFENPEDTVEIGGHEFRVACSGEPAYLGFQVGEYYVPAYPEAKPFNTSQNYGSADYDPEAGISPASLLQLEETDVTVDFSGFLPEELKEVTVRAFLGEKPDEKPLEIGDTVLWFKANDKFDPYTPNETVDLSQYASEDAEYSETGGGTAQIIAGTFDQLNPDNTRYIVHFTVSNLGDLLEMQAYTSARESIGNAYSVEKTEVQQENGNRETWYYYVINGRSQPVWELRSALVGLRFRDGSAALRKLQEKGDLSVDVYSGKLNDVSSASPITRQIWEQEDLSVSGGYPMDGAAMGNGWLTIELRHNGKSHLMHRTLNISHYKTYRYLNFGFRALKEDGTEWATQNDFWPYTQEGSDALHYDVRIISDDWDGKETGLAMTYNERYTENGLTAAVYEGIYQTEAEALLNQAVDIAEQFWGPDAAGYRKDYNEEVPFTVVLKKGETVVEIIHLLVTVKQYQKPQEQIYVGLSDYLWSFDNRIEATESKKEQNGTYYYTMLPQNPRNGQYYVYLTVSSTYPHDNYVNGKEDVKAAYAGNYASAEAAAGQTDIKEALFTPVGENGGYLVDFKNGAANFTIIDIKDKVYHVKLNTLAPVAELETKPQSTDTYFHIVNVTDTDGNDYDQYVIGSDNDSYYFNGFQTIFILKDGEPVTDSEIIPEFRIGKGVNLYKSHDTVSGTPVEQGTRTPFASGKPIYYSAASESGTHLRNYWVTFVTQQPGAKLFVNGADDKSHYENGMPVREVLLGAGASEYHDIFVANIGAEKLTGLYVRLENEKNIRLDDYWTISDATAELAGFTTTEKDAEHSHGELNNVAKIRLHQKEGAVGEIRGILVIGSTATGEEVRIKLKGSAGIPKITTENVVDGVKYVPYACVLQTNHMYRASGDNSVTFKLVSGTLPTGMWVKPNGEIYGVPRASGYFTFGVQATYRNQSSDTKKFTLYIAPNSDVNVYQASDISYKLEIPVGEEIKESEMTGPSPYHYELDASELTAGGEQLFRSEGPHPYFIDFWLDGEKLVEGTDYKSEDGSTILTISDATLRGKGNGPHTLAAEFREGNREDGNLKRTAQNLTIKGLPEPTPPAPNPPTPDPDNPPDNNNNNNNNNGNNNSNDNNKNPTTPATPTPTPDTGMPFTDVLPQHWFFDNVKWVYDNKYMQGVSETLFAPSQAITQATIVTVLSRVGKIDMSRFEGVTYPGIESGKWYTEPAIWAQQSGILPDFSSFTGEEPLNRNDMAIMLVKYMRSLGLNTAPPEQPAVFADAAQMTQDGSNAFQVLYQYNIFRGVGGNTMDPAGSTTRAQFAALMQRISDFAGTQK